MWRRSYPCVYCGPPSKYDFSFEVADEDMEAYDIMDNFKVALAARCALASAKTLPPGILA